MHISESKKIAYSLFTQMVVLLVVYAALSLFTIVKFLPQDPLALALPYSHASGAANMLLNLAIVTGLLAGGIYVVADNRPDMNLAYSGLLQQSYRLWTVLLVLAFIAGFLGQLEGRYRLELPVILDILQGILMVMFVVNIILSASLRTPFVMVWALGIILSVICVIIGIIPAADMIRDSVMSALAVNLNHHLAYILAGLALAFWLMTRFSNVMQQWADEGLYTTAGLLSIAGVLVSIAPLYPLGGLNLGAIPALIIVIAYIIFAAHSYRALSDRNPTVTLAAQWYALAVILLLLGVGFLGAMQSLPEVQVITRGTQFTTLQLNLAAFAVLAILLSAANQIAAELRGHNARITGFVPFWLVAFGIVIGELGLFGVGVTQALLERRLSVGYLDTQNLALPLYTVWIIGTLSAAVGIGIYALGFRARQPTR